MDRTCVETAHPRGPKDPLLGRGGSPGRRRLCERRIEGWGVRGEELLGSHKVVKDRTSPRVVVSLTGYCVFILSFPALILKPPLEECSRLD